MKKATRRTFLQRTGGGAAALGVGGFILGACGEDDDNTGNAASGAGPIKVGLVNALSGVLSITEKSIHNGALLAVEQINAAGGINGRKIEPIAEDYASDFTVAVQKAEKLIRQDEVAITIGGYTSASRVAMIPTFQSNDALFFYGTYYEGLECDTNTFYAGAVPNQFLIDYIPWVMENLGETIYIVGSDYIYPRTVSAIVTKLVEDGGGRVVGDRFFELGTTEFGAVVSDIQSKRPDVVLSNMVGDSTPAFYRQYRNAGLTADNIPIAATVTTEVEVQAMGPENAAGHYQTATYFQSLDNPANRAFVDAFHERFGANSVTHMPLVGTYNAVWLFAKAAAKAEDLSTGALREALVGATYEDNPEGQPTTIGGNHHCNHPSYVGQANDQGQYEIVAEFDPREANPFPSEVVPEDRQPECPTPFEG